MSFRDVRSVLIVAVAAGCGRLAFDPSPTDAPDADAASCIVDISAGRDHTCVVRSDGTVWCWGGNDEMQLGRVGPDSATPTPVDGVTGAVDVEAGSTFMCARTATEVLCWGNGVAGQIGNDAQLSTPIPTHVVGSENFIALTAGRSHACALSASNELHCWGYNFWGQLGLGDMMDRFSPSVVALSAVAVSASSNEHTCAIDTTGALYCFGSDGAGRLGNGPQGDSLTPVLAMMPAPSRHVAAGGDMTCAVLVDGTTACAGVNSSGQFGNGDTTLSAVGVRTLAASLTAISLGFSHGCGIDDQARVVCWGLNDAGQVGAPMMPMVLSPEIVNVPSAIQISLGSAHSCAHTVDGLYCWGNNDRFQLASANGATNIPTRVAVPCP